MQSALRLSVVVALALPSIATSVRVPLGPGPVPAGPDADRLSAAKELVREHNAIEMSEKVRPQWLGPNRGLGFVALAPIPKGEVVLVGAVSPSSAMRTDMDHPWESEAFSAFADRMAHHFDEQPGRGRLMLKLANLLFDRNASTSSSLGRYLSSCASSMGGYMQWPAHVRELLRGSALHKAAEIRVAHFRSLAPELLAAWPWPSTAPSEEDLIGTLLKAHVMLNSRAFRDIRFGVKLVPVLDIVNHASQGRGNSEYFFSKLDWYVEATTDISVGDELLMSYTSLSKAFLETWSDFGFFDPTANVHAALIDVPICAANLQGP